MKIVFSSLEHDGYDPRRGKSFEYNNFYRQLVALGHVVHFASFGRVVAADRETFNRELLELVQTVRPDVFFGFLYTDEFEPAVLDKIKALVPSVGWFSDDHWRLENYSRFYASHFTRAVTTWSKAPEEYAHYGITNVIRSQWACNTADYHPLETAQDIDVSFVGMHTAHRARIIRELRRSGIQVATWGAGWGSGKLSFPELVQLFSRSKINLNLNPPMSALALKPIAQIFLRRSMNRIVPDIGHVSRNLRSYFRKRIPQIKARPFEISGCGGFCLSGFADDIENYYVPEKEMVFYRDTNELAEKIHYYLNHEDERQAIARAGYERTIREHTYQKRFEKIFKEIGLV